MQMIENYTVNGTETGFLPCGDLSLAYRISGFSVRKGGAVRGYLIDIRDATEEKKNLELLKKIAKNAEIVDFPNHSHNDLFFDQSQVPTYLKLMRQKTKRP